MQSRTLAYWKILALCLPAWLAACGGGDDDTATTEPSAPPAATVSIGGQVGTPSALTADDLRKQAAITQTVNYKSGSTPQTRTYTGASLWSVLSAAGIKTDSAIKNDLLTKYVVATGADGYQVVFSTGELNPDLGNLPSIIAYAETVNGTSGALSSDDGPFRLTAPGDVKGGRYVSLLTSVDAHASGSTRTGTGGGPATTFAVSGDVQNAGTFDLAALQAMPAVTYQLGAASYTGVDLWYLLNTVAGFKTAAGAHNPTLGMYAVATGSDGYQTLISLGEIDPGFGARQDVVAYEVDGAPLDRNGTFRLVVSGDGKPSRSVSNLIDIQVFTAPAP